MQQHHKSIAIEGPPRDRDYSLQQRQEFSPMHSRLRHKPVSLLWIKGPFFASGAFRIDEVIVLWWMWVHVCERVFLDFSLSMCEGTETSFLNVCSGKVYVECMFREQVPIYLFTWLFRVLERVPMDIFPQVWSVCRSYVGGEPVWWRGLEDVVVVVA